ncbi:INO80 complex subunit D isoform X2 [Octopus sinensis]|nr:INO80 complex subunit D isoform X2 [Octopus sinensis]
MLQQREAKAKTERGDGDIFLDSRMSFKDRVKSKFHLKQCEGKEDSIEDPEDPYAFPDPVSVDVLKTSTNPSHNSTTTTTTVTTVTTTTTTATTITTNNNNANINNNNNIVIFGNAATIAVSSAVPCSTNNGSGSTGGLSTSGKPVESVASHQPPQWARASAETSATAAASSGIGTPIAKLYPELAEKLEGRKTQKPDQKSKGKVESSRTMNRLQTKIAQNKIKDKLKKTQDYPGSTTQCLSSTPLVSQALNLSSSACCKTASEPAVAIAFMKPSPSVALTTTVAKPVTDDGFSISETYVKSSPTNLPTAALSPGLTQVSISTPPSSQPPPPPLPPPSPLQPPLPAASSHTDSLQNMSTSNISSTLNVTVSESKVSHKLPASPPMSPSGHSSLLKCQLKSPCPNSTKSETVWSPSHNAPNSPQHTEPKFSVLHTKPNKLNVPDNKEVISKLKSESAMAFYMMHQKKAIQNHDWLNCGLNSSEDEENSEDEHLPWQNDWLVLSSDEDVKDENLSPHYRSRKLAIRRARLRRHVVQSQVAGCFNANIQLNKNKATLALIHALRDKPPAALKSLHFVLNKPQKKCNVHKMSGLRKRFCCYRNEDDGKCNKKALPCTNHCIKHIMYNVDQQLFDYCTAKFADNTQCCVPVFDIKHDLPLCQEHAAKADNYQKVQSNESKHKRPRKKPKPAALTKTKSKKKKKKNQRCNVRPQESVRRAERLENTEPVSVDESPNIVASASSATANNATAAAKTVVTTSQSSIPPITTAVLDTSSILQDSLLSAPEKTGNLLPNLPPPKRTSISLHLPMDLPPVTTSSAVGSSAELNHIDFAKLSKNFQDLGSVLDGGGFSPDSIDKSFELPLDQASKLLEQDLQEVFNNDTFDIFSGRNGEYDPTKEESEDLERALAAAYKDIRDAKEKLDKLSRVGDQSSQLMDVNDEEWTKHIADSLLNSVQPNTVPVTATTLTTGNGLASELMKDNLNVLDSSDLTANSLPMSGQVINQPVGSITTATSNGGTSVLPYGWINFNMASVPSSLSDQPLSNCNNLFINSKHVPLASTQSIASDLALTSSQQLSTNVSHLSSSIYRSASNNRTVLTTTSKETAIEGNTSLGGMAPQQVSVEPKPLSSSESSLAAATSQQANCQEATRTISAHAAAVTSAQTGLSAHVNINTQTSTQLTTTSIQMPSSQTAILPTLLSMQSGSIRPGIWSAGGVTAGIPIHYYNGLPSSGRIPFVQNMDSGPPPGSSAKFQLNSHLDSGEYKQDLTFTSLPHSMGTSHGGAQRTRTEKNQGAKPGSITQLNSSGENT